MITLIMGIFYSLIYSEDLVETSTEDNNILKEVITDKNEALNKCINYNNILYIIQGGNNKQLGFCYNFEEAKYYINNEIKNMCIVSLLNNYILNRKEYETPNSYIIEIYERNPNILLSYKSLLCKYTIFFVREINCSNLKQLIKDNDLDVFFNPFENELDSPNRDIFVNGNISKVPLGENYHSHYNHVFH
jgi:hypothetical protein